MLNYKFNSILLERLSDLEKIKLKYETKLKKVEYIKHDSPIIKAIEMSNIQYRIDETQKLIDINNEFYKINGGTYQ